MSGHCRAYLSQNTYGIYLLHFKDRRYYIFSNTNIVTFVCIVCLFRFSVQKGWNFECFSCWEDGYGQAINKLMSDIQV